MPQGGSKPGERRGGRQKGTPNKVNKALKDMILGALADAGGQEYLLRQAETEPKAFLALLGRVLPTEIKGDQQVTIAGLDWKALLKPKTTDDAA